MKLTFAAVVALCAFASGPSFGANTPESSQSAATRGTPLSPSKRFVAPQLVQAEMIRNGLRLQKIDPDSPQGKRLITFLTGFLNNPQAMKGLANMADMSIGPEARMSILRLMAEGGDGRESLCGDSWAKADMFEMARTLSPTAFDRRMALLDLFVQPRPNKGDEHYSLAERLEANAWLNTLTVPDEASPDGELARREHVCGAIRTVVAEMDKMPTRLQQRRSYEFFRAILRKPTAAADIVAAPQAYFDEMFDEKVFPAALRRRLPRDGSHPLPFKRIVFEGRWVSELPGESGPVRDTYINRRNNGVVAELLEARGTDTENSRVFYSLIYGHDRLRNQLVVKHGAYRLSQRPELAGALLGPGDVRPSVGQTYQVASTEPPLNKEYLPFSQCEIGESRPAAEISPALTGRAISVQCTSPRPDKGLPCMSRDVWLQDYGLMVGLEWNVSGAKGHFEIDKVVVE